jgi:hypothetical protein
MRSSLTVDRPPDTVFCVNDLLTLEDQVLGPPGGPAAPPPARRAESHPEEVPVIKAAGEAARTPLHRTSRLLSVFPRRCRHTRDTIAGYLFIAPFFAFYGVFLVYPSIAGFWISLHRWGLLGTDIIFVGLQNYSQLRQATDGRTYRPHLDRPKRRTVYYGCCERSGLFQDAVPSEAGAVP